MSRALTQLEKEIQALSIEEKRELLRALVADLDKFSEPHVERAWLEAAQRRHRELVSGESEGVPGSPRSSDRIRSRLGQCSVRRGP
jgi:hypothetical protein